MLLAKAQSRGNVFCLFWDCIFVVDHALALPYVQVDAIDGQERLLDDSARDESLVATGICAPV
jgi:hypothetical protein